MKSSRRVGPAGRVLTLALSLLLVACGGGGGGGGGLPPESPPATITVSGTASKGLLKNAIVKAFHVNGDGSLTLWKESTTDQEGRYALTGLPSGQVLLVEVSAGADTRMADEATNEASVPLPTGFKLRAAVVTQDGGENTVQITPFSDMAVAKALGQGGLTAGNVEGANADMRAYVGFDVLSETPAFANGGTAPTNKAALLLAAVSHLAANTTTLQALGCANLAGTGEKVKCVVEKMAQRGSSDAWLATALGDAKDHQASQDYLGTELPLQPSVQSASLTPQPSHADGVAAARALVASLRLNRAGLFGSNGDTLQARLQSVRAGFEATPELISASHRGLLQVILAAGGQLDAARNGALTGPLPGIHGIYRPINKDVLNVGCSFFTDAAYTQLATTYDQSQYVACRVTHAFLLTDSGHVAVQHRVLIQPVAGHAHDYLVRTQVVRQAADWNGTEWVMSNAPAQVLSPYRSADLTVALGGVDLFGDFSLNGGLAPTVHRDGQHDAGGLDLDLAITRSSSIAGADRLSLVGLLERVDDNGALLSSVQLKEGSFFQAYAASTQAGVPLDHSQTRVRLVLEAQTGAGQGVAGELQLWFFKADRQGVAVPTYSEFKGRITDGDGTVLFDGGSTLQMAGVANHDSSQPDDVGNQVARLATLEGELFVPGAPLLDVKLTFNGAGDRHFWMTGQYRQAGMVVNVNGGGDQWGRVTFSSSTGVSLTVTPEGLLSPITKANVVVGEIDVAQGRITYRDNTYDTF